MTPHNISPDFDTFDKLYQSGKGQIVWQWIPSDLETPVSAYLKLCAQEQYAFLLESIEGGASLGRYSIIGLAPDLLWRSKKGVVETKSPEQSSWSPSQDAPLNSLRRVINESTVDNISADLPPMCAFGMFGYIGYDMIRLVEKIPDNNPDNLHIPDAMLMRPSVLAVFDNIKNMLCIATPVYPRTNSNAREEYHAARLRLEDIVTRLCEPLDPALLTHKSTVKTPLEITSNIDKQNYLDNVKQAVEYINAGEIFQVVLSQRFTADFDLPSFELYRTLRSINPSPFLFHLKQDDFALVGSSPEILVRVRDGKVTIRPIAGTRKRGATSAEDKALAEDLLADEKECAEHLMLLDLGRNDVGRVAEIGSVDVTDKFAIELYSHVMHIVSNVEGKIRDNVDIIDALFAGFPAGTVSGAPKIRAMEIIDELETSRRASYAGGIGYFSAHTMDSCIALRTALLKDGKIHVQAGGGIVADSSPESEYQECRNKARAVFSAAEAAIKRYAS